MVNEIRIRCFLTLAETLSFTETAKQLYMTQQGVSKHIARIEEEMGCALFVRSRRTVSLTEAGVRCYKLFSDFFPRYEQFVQEFRTNREERNNTLRVGYQNWLDFGAVPSLACEALRRENPGLELAGERHSPGALYRKLLAEELDVVLICERYAPASAGLRSLELTRTPMMLFVSSAHPGNAEGADYRAFSEETYLVDSFENEGHLVSVTRASQEVQGYGMSFRRIQVMPNRDSVYTAVELGQGVTAGCAMTQILSSGAVCAYPIGALESLLCLWRVKEKAPLAERFAQLLRQEYQKPSR